MENILQAMDAEEIKMVTTDHGKSRRCNYCFRHNLGTAEIESAFVAHPKVAEAA